MSPDALRAERRQRCVDQMERAGIDVLLLGREGNIRYVTGAHRLWLAGMRGWAPSCVVVRRTAAVHLLSITDCGLPPEIPADRLYPITWNPMNLLGAVATIEGVADATTIGVDGSTPLMRDLVAGVLPNARLVDGDGILRAARRTKTGAELDALRAATRAASEAVSVGFERLLDGAEPALVEGAVRRRAAELGSTAVSAPIDVTPWSVAATTLLDGYEGAAGRVTGPPAERVDALRSALTAACGPGERLSSLLDAYGACGEQVPPGIVARGTGVGAEEPVLRASGVRGDEVLEPGMALVVRAAVAHDDVWPGTVEQVLITGDGREVLTTG